MCSRRCQPTAPNGAKEAKADTTPTHVWRHTNATENRSHCLATVFRFTCSSESAERGSNRATSTEWLYRAFIILPVFAGPARSPGTSLYCGVLAGGATSCIVRCKNCLEILSVENSTDFWRHFLGMSATCLLSLNFLCPLSLLPSLPRSLCRSPWLDAVAAGLPLCFHSLLR